MGKTLSDKVWESHVVRRPAVSPTCSTSTSTSCTRSPARRLSTGSRPAGRPVRRPDLTLATEDHNTPTENIGLPIADPVSRLQVDTLRKNAAEFGVLDPLARRQGPGHRARRRPAAQGPSRA